MAEIKKSRNRIRKAVAHHLVCDCEDLLPYAWRNPMPIDTRKCSKVLRDMELAKIARLAPPKTKK